MADLPGAVLFSCNYNRVRSPMAQALMRLTFGDRIYVESCGLKPGGDDVDPFVLSVMDELGADLTDFQPKTFGELVDGSFDLVISLTPEAHHRAIELTRARSVDLEYWPTHDPTLAAGSRDVMLDAYRAVRDALQARILERFGKPSTFGG